MFKILVTIRYSLGGNAVTSQVISFDTEEQANRAIEIISYEYNTSHITKLY